MSDPTETMHKQARAQTEETLRFSINAWPMKQSLASLPGPLR